MLRPKPFSSFFLALAIPLIALGTANPLSGQEPADWADNLLFHTFSIAAIDPATGESGVAVTTRVSCVGNGVPWVRAGVGAVATQSFTRVEYGPELLDMLEQGIAPAEALRRAVEADEDRDGRQVGVVGMDGTSGQYTGSGAFDWAGHRSGPNYTTQGNLLTGADVLEAVATTFESSAGLGRHLGDRLIEALTAGQMIGGDARAGRRQSAAVVVADPREGRSRRPDGITVNINVCEHATPVLEMRRIYNTISQTLGYRTLQQFSGGDVVQLKTILHALGYFRPEAESLDLGDRGLSVFDQEAVDAVDAFRKVEGLSTSEVGSPPGLVEESTISLLWTRVEEAGKTEEVNSVVRRLTAVRR
jgi:uncharacterized Ntn-hydrolase superfamily protein